MILSHARVLTNEQVLRTHEGSLEILEQVGILVRNEKAKSRFAEHGCDVDFDTEIVKFPTNITEHYRKLVPASFTLHAPNAGALAPDVDARVRAGLKGLVAGVSLPPKGWEPPTAKRGRRRTGRRSQVA